MALIVKIGANLDGFDKQMRKLTKDVNKVGDKLKNAGAALSTAVTLPVLAIGAAAIKTGIDFEAAMSKVAAISGATGDDLAKLEEQARNLGATTQFSASEAASGMEFLAMAGFKTQDIIKAMPGLLDLAAAGAMDLGAAADITSNIMSGFGIEAEQAGHISDVLAKAASSANTDVSQLGEAMKYLAPTANTLGWTMEEATAAVMAMSDAGIQGSLAGQAFGSSLGRLAKPTSAMSKVMEETGMSFFDAEGNMKSMPEVIKEIEKGTQGMTAEQKTATLTTLFGAEAFKHWAVMLDKGSEALGSNTQMLVDADGAASQMAETMNDNLAGRLKELKSAFEEMGLIIYENLKPALETIVEAVKGLADWFNSLSPSTQNLIIGLAGLAAVVGPLLTIIGVAIILFGQLSAALSILGISMSVALWWVLAIIAALALIVGVVVYWDEIKAYFVKFWAFLKAAFKAALNVIKSMITAYFNAYKTVILTVWNVIKTASSATWSALKTIIMTPVNYIKSAVSAAFTGMKTTALGAWNGLKSGMKSVINGIIRMVNVFIKGFNTPGKLLNMIPGVNVPTIPTIPMLATGGNVFGSGSAIVGEAGPELLEKSGSSVRVTPLSAQEKARGIGGSTSFEGMFKGANFNVRSDEDIHRIARELNNLIKSGRRKV